MMVLVMALWLLAWWTLVPGYGSGFGLSLNPSPDTSFLFPTSYFAILVYFVFYYAPCMLGLA